MCGQGHLPAVPPLCLCSSYDKIKYGFLSSYFNAVFIALEMVMDFGEKEAEKDNVALSIRLDVITHSGW